MISRKNTVAGKLLNLHTYFAIKTFVKFVCFFRENVVWDSNRPDLHTNFWAICRKNGYRKTVSEQNEVAWRVNSNLAQMFVLIWEPIKIQSVSKRVLAFHILGVCSEKSKQTKTLKSWVLIIKIRQITWENCEKWTKVRTLKFCAEISEFFCHSDFTWNKFWKFKKF